MELLFDCHNDNKIACACAAQCEHPKTQTLESTGLSAPSSCRKWCLLITPPLANNIVSFDAATCIEHTCTTCTTVPLSQRLCVRIVLSSPSWQACSNSSAGTGFGGEACDRMNVHRQMHQDMSQHHLLPAPTPFGRGSLCHSATVTVTGNIPTHLLGQPI